LSKVPEQSIDSMIRWGSDYDQRCADRLKAFREHGISDAKAGKPMARTFANLGGEYCSIEGSYYERGYRSILSKEEEQEIVKQKRLF
jgi:hypothetical protein